MSTLTAPARAVNAKSTPADPWLEPPAYAVPVAALAFGVRVRHTVIPGVWKVVREASRLDSTSRFHVRVREQTADRSLFGPVLSWRVDEIAGLVTDEPKAEPAAVKYDVVTLDGSAPVAAAVNRDNITVDGECTARPLVVAMAISIDGTHYSVAPLAPAPDAVKAYRFRKVDGDEAQHDLDETADGASCTCGDFVWRHGGLDDLGCKHIRAARMMGLIAEAPEPGHKYDDITLVDEPDPRDAYNDAREKLARLAEAEDAVRREGEGINSIDTLPVEPEPCCEPSEPAACTACCTVQHPPLPTDDVEGDDDWHAADVISLGPAADPLDDEPPARTLAEQVLGHARELRAIGSPLHDLLAERAEALAAEIRYLDASNVAQYRDRREVALDAARDAAEARHRAACCC